MEFETFVPCHITGFFEIVEGQDPLTSGSRGCGVVIDGGVTTEVTLEEADENSIQCSINGDEALCPVTDSVVEEVLDMVYDTYSVRVAHTTDLPVGCGFGASASGALGTAFALNEVLELDLPETVCGRMAHKAEVENRTGLGDVIAELAGGLVIRTVPGAPGVGETEAIPCDLSVVAKVMGEPILTKDVLDSEKVEAINREGRACLDDLMKEKTPANFMHLSRGFAEKTGLMGPEVAGAVTALEGEGIQASMAMLGNTVFALTDAPEEAVEVLGEGAMVFRVYG
jgi:pantoate kinase